MNGLKRIKEEKVPEAVKALMAQKISEEKVPVEVRQFMELQTISEQDVPEEVKQLVQTETKEIETKEPKKSFWTKIKETGKELKDIGGVKGLFKMAKGLGMPDVDATEAQAAESVGKRKAYAAEQEDLYFFDVQRAITDPTYKKRKEEISKAGIETTIQSLKETPQAMAELGAELTSSALFGWKKPLEWTESKGYTGRVEDVPAKIAGNTLRIAVELATAGAAGKVIEKSIAPITARLGRFGPIAAKWIASGVEGMVFWGEDETLDQALDYLDKEKALTWENIGKSTKAINDEAIAGGAIQFLNFIPRTSIRVPLTMGARYWRETKKEARELTPKAKSKKIYKTGFQGLYSLFFGGMRLPEQEPEFIDVTPRGEEAIKSSMQGITQHLPPQFYAAPSNVQGAFISKSIDIVDRTGSIAKGVDAAMKATKIGEIDLSSQAAMDNMNKSAEQVKKVFNPESKFPAEFKKLESVQRAEALNQISTELANGKTVEQAVKVSSLPKDTPKVKIPKGVPRDKLVVKDYARIPDNEASLEVEKVKEKSPRIKNTIKKIKAQEKVFFMETQELKKEIIVNPFPEKKVKTSEIVKELAKDSTHVDSLANRYNINVYNFSGGIDITLTKQTDLEQLSKDYPVLDVLVKDVNGNRALIDIVTFNKLIKKKPFSDRVRDVRLDTLDQRKTSKEIEAQEYFMEALNPQQLLETEKTTTTKKLIKVDNIKISGDSSISNVQTAKFRQAFFNNKIRKLLKNLKIKEIVIEPPYKFGLSEQANINTNTKIIRINADAINPTQTLFHELGHQTFNNFSKENQKILIEQIKNSKEPSLQGYLSIGAYEEAVADSIHSGIIKNMPMPTDPSDEDLDNVYDENGINNYTGEQLGEAGQLNIQRVKSGTVDAWKAGTQVIKDIKESVAEWGVRGYGLSDVRKFEQTSLMHNDGMLAEEVGKIVNAALPSTVTADDWEIISRAAEEFSPGTDKYTPALASKFMDATKELQLRGVDAEKLGSNLIQLNNYIGDLKQEMGGLGLKFPESFLASSKSEIVSRKAKIENLQEKIDVPPENLDPEKLEDYIAKKESLIESHEKAIAELTALREEAPNWSYIPREVLDRHGELLSRNIASGRIKKMDLQKFRTMIDKAKKRKIPLRRIADQWFKDMNLSYEKDIRKTVARDLFKTNKQYITYSWLRDNIKQDVEITKPAFHPDVYKNPDDYKMPVDIYKKGSMTNRLFKDQMFRLQDLPQDEYGWEIEEQSTGFQYGKTPEETQGKFVRFPDGSRFKLTGKKGQEAFEADMVLHKYMANAIKDLQPHDPGPLWFQNLNAAHWLHKRLTFIFNVKMFSNDMWQMTEELYPVWGHVKKFKKSAEEYFTRSGDFEIARLGGLFDKDYVNIYEDTERLLKTAISGTEDTIVENLTRMIGGIGKDVKNISNAFRAQDIRKLSQDVIKFLDDASLPIWTMHDIALYDLSKHYRYDLKMSWPKSIEKAKDTLGGGGFFTKDAQKIMNVGFKTATFGARMLKRHIDMVETVAKSPFTKELPEAERNKLIGFTLKHLIATLSSALVAGGYMQWKLTHQGRLEKEIEIDLMSKFSPEMQTFFKKAGIKVPPLKKTKTITLASGGWFLERLLNRKISKSLEYRYNYALNFTTRILQMLEGKDIYDWSGRLRVDSTESGPVRAAQWADFMVRDYLQVPEKLSKKESDALLSNFEKWYSVVTQTPVYYRDPDRFPSLWNRLYNRHVKRRPLDTEILQLEVNAEKQRIRKAGDALQEALFDPKEKQLIKPLLARYKIKTVGDIERVLDTITNKTIKRRLFKTLPGVNKLSTFEQMSAKGQKEVADLLPKTLGPYEEYIQQRR